MNHVLLIISLIDGQPASSVQYAMDNAHKCLEASSVAATAVKEYMDEMTQLEKMAQGN